MSGKHTPGPWKATRPWRFVGPLGSPHVAALYRHHPKLSDEQLEANARLIAAAPAMLEALEWYADEWHYRASSVDGRSDFVSVFIDRGTRARHTLAQARGEEVNSND